MLSLIPIKYVFFLPFFLFFGCYSKSRLVGEDRLRAQETSHHLKSLVVHRLHQILKADRAHLGLQLVDLPFKHQSPSKKKHSHEMLRKSEVHLASKVRGQRKCKDGIKGSARRDVALQMFVVHFLLAFIRLDVTGRVHQSTGGSQERERSVNFLLLPYG